MPKFFIDTLDGQVIFDDEGYDLPDHQAVKKLVQRVLSDLMSREESDETGTRLRADVRNEDGTLIMTARLMMTIEEFKN